MHVVNITRYVIRIKKNLHNRIEIIKIESNRKGYESLHSYLKPLMKLHKPWAYKQKFKVSPLVQEYVYNKQNLSALGYIRPPRQAQRSLSSTAQFWRTRETLCMNRKRSLLSMRNLFLGCSLKPRPNSRAFAAVWYSGLSYSHRFYQQTDARTRKSTLKRENTIDLPRSSRFGNFKA